MRQGCRRYCNDPGTDSLEGLSGGLGTIFLNCQSIGISRVSASQFKEFYCIIQVIKLRKMRNAVPVAHMKEKRCIWGFGGDIRRIDTMWKT
jgi:hypothetical protein